MKGELKQQEEIVCVCLVVGCMHDRSCRLVIPNSFQKETLFSKAGR
ncbi:hypothetical protein CSUI_011047, partial [Cystoisospora suis]